MPATGCFPLPNPGSLAQVAETEWSCCAFAVGSDPQVQMRVQVQVQVSVACPDVQVQIQGQGQVQVQVQVFVRGQVGWVG